MKILVDNGHGMNTAGKRSPDGSLLEYQWTRQIADMIVHNLRTEGYDAMRIVKEDKDVSLSERAKRVNRICDQEGADNVVLLSIHCNASKNGEWGSAKGWSAYTSIGKTRSDDLASMLYVEAAKTLTGHIRYDYSDGDPDFEADFYVLRKTKCAAVLTENFFMDNKEDLKYMLSDRGKTAIARVHSDAIVKYVSKYGKK